jgi:hypothetical protein
MNAVWGETLVAYFGMGRPEALGVPGCTAAVRCSISVRSARLRRFLNLHGTSLLAAVLLGSSGAYAQTMGELKGTVADTAGVPIPGSLVEATSPALIRPRKTSTDAEGRFRFPYLPPGNYEVLARMTGFRDTVARDVRVSLGESTTLPMTLSVSTEASVEVSAVHGLIDTENARAGISVAEKDLSNLPLGRNYASAAYLVAGVGQDVLGPTFYGASSLENSYVTDGLNTTGIKLGGQGKLLPMEFVKEVEIRSGGYEAEYGKALGGNINVITRKGGNEYHGNVFGYYDSDALGASDRHAAERSAIGLDQLEVPNRYDVGLTLGGPVVRDRLWFFAAYDRARTEQPYQAVDHFVYAPSSVEFVYDARTETTSTDLFALNLSWAPSPSGSLAISVFGDPASLSGRPCVECPGVTSPWATSAGPPSATVIERETGGTDVSLRWTGFVGRGVVEALYGYHEERRIESNAYTDRAVASEYRRGYNQLTAGSGPISVLDGLVDETYRRNVLGLNGSLVVGDHELKAGLEGALENPGRRSFWAGGQYVISYLSADGQFEYALHRFHPKTPLNCTMRIDGTTGDFGYIHRTECLRWEPTAYVRSDFRTRSGSAFVQDSWRPLSNLTVKAGVRYDAQELVDANGVVRLRTRNEWSPRVAAAWDPGANGRSKVFASAGRYYQAIPQDLQAKAMSNEYDAFAYNYSPGSDLTNDPALYPYSYVYGGMYFPEGLGASYQDEVTAGAELQIGGGWSIGARGTYRALGRALEDRCDVFDPRAGIQDLVPEATSLTTCALVNPGVGAAGQLNDPSNPDCFEDFPANTTPRPCETVHPRRYYRGIETVVQA